MRYRCIYDSSNCGNEPAYYVLAGCLNQHIIEGAICQTHLDVWVALFNDQDLACTDCAEDLTEYEVTDTMKLVL